VIASEGFEVVTGVAGGEVVVDPPPLVPVDGAPPEEPEVLVGLPLVEPLLPEVPALEFELPPELPPLFGDEVGC
jgi:hypothetical protein